MSSCDMLQEEYLKINILTHGNIQSTKCVCGGGGVRELKCLQSDLKTCY